MKRTRKEEEAENEPTVNFSWNERQRTKIKKTNITAQNTGECCQNVKSLSLDAASWSNSHFVIHAGELLYVVLRRYY